MHLAGVEAPVLLPGPDARAAYDAYRHALKRAAVFPGVELPAYERNSHSPGGDKPVIGIIASEPQALTGGLRVKELIAAVRRMGADPVLIPPCADATVPASRREAALTAMAAELDGLIGPGGADVDPAIYGAANTFSENTNLMRDRFEADFALVAMRADLFMFGICRSHQLWNFAAGGDGIQDVQAEGYSSVSQRQKDYGLQPHEPFVLRDHTGAVMFENNVELLRDCTIASIVGASMLLTNSYHHQAVKTPGRGLRATGMVLDPVTGKNTIEATEGPKLISVQWHPELMIHDEKEQRLLETVGRRAHIFHLWKSAPAALEAAMRDSAIPFDAQDRAFAAELVSGKLARG